MASDEHKWPLEWEQIAAERGYRRYDNWVDFGPLRLYKNTVYINENGGSHDDNTERWMPLERYINEVAGNE